MVAFVAQEQLCDKLGRQFELRWPSELTVQVLPIGCLGGKPFVTKGINTEYYGCRRYEGGSGAMEEDKVLLLLLNEIKEMSRLQKDEKRPIQEMDS